MNIKNKAVWALILIADFLFLAYFSVLSVNARPHFDDLAFLTMLKDMSIPEYIHSYYVNESGAFIGYFVNGLLFSAINLFGHAKILPILWILLGVVICCCAVRVYSGSFIWREQLPIVVLLYSIYIFANLDAAISFWFCGMSYCLKGPLALLLLSFISRRSLCKTDVLVVGLLAFWIGGENAAFSCVMLATLGIYALTILGSYKWKLSSAFEDTRGKKVLLALSAMLVSFAVVVVAPGNYVRLGSPEFETMQRPASIFEWLIICVKCMATYCYFLAFNIHWYAIAGGTAWFWGKSAKKRISLSRRVIYCLAGFWLVELVLFSMPQSFLFGGFGYQRVWTPMCFVTMVCVAVSFYILGNTSAKDINFSIPTCCAGLALLSAVLIWHIGTDSKAVTEYSQAYDARWAELSSVPSEQTETIVLEKLKTPYTTDLKFDIYSLIGRQKNTRPELYYVPDSAPDLHVGALRDYFKIKAKIEIVEPAGK